MRNRQRRRRQPNPADQLRRELAWELGGGPVEAARWAMRRLKMLDDLERWMAARDKARRSAPGRFGAG